MPSKHSNGCDKTSIQSKILDPDLTGKVILITGGTGGIGAELVVHLSHLPQPPAHIIFTGRNANSANAVMDRCHRGRHRDDSITNNDDDGGGGDPLPQPDHAIGGASPLPLSSNDTASCGRRRPEISFVTMDLSSLDSVSTASNQILALLQRQGQGQGHDNGGRGRRLDILLANAGIMAHPPGLSTDGYEIQFATNHLGHALLIRKLLPLMLETAALPSPSTNTSTPPASSAQATEHGTRAEHGNSEGNGEIGQDDEEEEGSDVRIIITSSTGWRLGKTDNFPFEDLAKGDLFEGRTFFAKSLRYGNSKLANVVYARELALRYGDEPVLPTGGESDGNGGAGGGPTSKKKKGILSLSLTPGVVGTGLVNDLPWADRALVYASQLGKILTVQEGIRNHLWAISAPCGEIHPGAFYEPVGRPWTKSWSDRVEGNTSGIGRKMWEFTEELIGPWL